MVAVTADVLTSPALPVLLQLEAAGARFRVDGDQFLVSLRGVLTPEQRLILRHQAAVRVLVAIVTDAGVRDRVVEFRPACGRSSAQLPRVCSR
jgi:hypothetical protein